MAALLRVMGMLLLVGGVLSAIVGAMRFPESMPTGTPAQIVHVVDYYEERPRATFLHVLDASLLPFGSVGITEGGGDPGEPAFFLIPMVPEDHPLQREMDRHAHALQGGDAAAAERWESYVRQPPDWSEVQLLALTTATSTWAAEHAISVETHAIEGVVRPAAEALSPAVLALLQDRTRGFDPGRVAILYIGEVPPERGAMQLTTALGVLAALLGLATIVATFWARRRPSWLQ